MSRSADLRSGPLRDNATESSSRGRGAASGGGSGGFSFADGHSEIHRWLDKRTTPPLVKGDFLPGPSSAPWVPSLNNRDITWMQERATRKIN